MDKCPICKSPIIGYDNYYEDANICNCYRCGEFTISEDAIKFQCRFLKEKQIAYISGWIRENQNVTISTKLFEDVLNNLKLPTLEHRATNLLKSFTDTYDLIGGSNVINFNNLEGIINLIDNNKQDECKDIKILSKDLKYLAVTWSCDIKELIFIYKDYLMNEMKYLKGFNKDFCQITPTGWAYLESLRQANPESKKAFVAMWFTDEMKETCEKHIKPAAKKAGGYIAEPINDKDYNGNINDAIIGEIRSSKFLIADFTGNRGGVYYEAGFAHGFNIPVIYTCSEDWWNKEINMKVEAELENKKTETVTIKEIREVHFDVEHYNFIIWKDGADLYTKLLNRIKATIT